MISIIVGNTYALEHLLIHYEDRTSKLIFMRRVRNYLTTHNVPHTISIPSQMRKPHLTAIYYYKLL